MISDCNTAAMASNWIGDRAQSHMNLFREYSSISEIYVRYAYRSYDTSKSLFALSSTVDRMKPLIFGPILLIRPYEASIRHASLVSFSRTAAQRSSRHSRAGSISRDRVRSVVRCRDVPVPSASEFVASLRAREIGGVTRKQETKFRLCRAVGIDDGSFDGVVGKTERSGLAAYRIDPLSIRLMWMQKCATRPKLASSAASSAGSIRC